MLENQRDEAATAARNFLCKGKRGSYVSLSGHEYLRGKDRSIRWNTLYEREKGLCCVCGRWRDRDKADMDHIKGKRPKIRCDCYGTLLVDGTVCTNIRLICTMDPNKGIQAPCHQQRHNREPRWASKRRNARLLGIGA